MDDLVIISDEKREIPRRMTTLFYCRRETGFPKECREFLEFIQRYRNHAAHSEKTTYKK